VEDLTDEALSHEELDGGAGEGAVDLQALNFSLRNYILTLYEIFYNISYTNN